MSTEGGEGIKGTDQEIQAVGEKADAKGKITDEDLEAAIDPDIANFMKSLSGSVDFVERDPHGTEVLLGLLAEDEMLQVPKSRDEILEEVDGDLEKLGGSEREQYDALTEADERSLELKRKRALDAPPDRHFGQTTDENIHAGTEVAEGYANKLPFVDPLKSLREVDQLPVPEEVIARELLAIADMGEDSSTEERIEAYEKVLEQITENPEAASLESLLRIIDAEITLTEEYYTTSREAGQATETHTDSEPTKLMTLKKSKIAISRLMNGEELSFVDDEAESVAIEEYLRKKRMLFETAAENTDDPEGRARYEAGAAYFSALYEEKVPD
jgi:hypothetical protein